jgi:hypothetical protein
MPSAQVDVTAPVVEEQKIDVSAEQITTAEPESEEQSAVKLEDGIEKVNERSNSAQENGGDSAGTKIEDNGIDKPVKREDTAEKHTGHKSSAKGPYKHRNNSKFDPSVAEISSDPAEIRKQARLPPPNSP